MVEKQYPYLEDTSSENLITMLREVMRLGTEEEDADFTKEIHEILKRRK